jgi:hypothetical protein
MSASQDEIRRNRRQNFPAELAEPNRCRPRVGDCDDAAHEVFLIAGDVCGVSVSTMTMRPR